MRCQELENHSMSFINFVEHDIYSEIKRR